MKSSVIRLLAQFPLKTYKPENIVDDPLSLELQQRTFPFGTHDKNKEGFILLINKYVRDSNHGNIIMSVDPNCLFVQCVLTKKHGFTSPTDSVVDEVNGPQIMVVDRSDVPMLITNSNECTRKNELLSLVRDRYLNLKERQWYDLLDDTLLITWKQQCLKVVTPGEVIDTSYDILFKNDDGSFLKALPSKEQDYLYEKTKTLLDQFEQEYDSLFDNDANYFPFRLDSLIYCILQGPNVPIQQYIQDHYPKLCSTKSLSQL